MDSSIDNIFDWGPEYLVKNCDFTTDEEKKEQAQVALCQLNNSELNLLYIMIALLINVVYLKYQKHAVVCKTEGMQYNRINFKPPRILGSLLTISALIFFFNQQNCINNTETNADSSMSAGLVSLLALGAGTLNLCNIADDKETEVI